MFGGPDKVVIVYGDWSEGQCRKYNAPTPGVAMQHVFRPYGYATYLVNEFHRDVMAAHNMVNLLKSQCLRKERPAYLTRPVVSVSKRPHSG